MTNIIFSDIKMSHGGQDAKLPTLTRDSKGVSSFISSELVVHGMPGQRLQSFKVCATLCSVSSAM